MIPRIRRFVGYVGLAGALALTGCSSSGGNDGTAPTTGDSVSQSAAGGSRPDAATKQAITKAFKLFFDTDTSVTASVGVLQHGPKFRKTLAAESNSPSAKGITAKVSKIALQGDDLAQVTFTLMTGSSPLLPDVPGYAVREAGKWKVAAQTFCRLLTLEGTAPSFCKNKSIIALPS
jgi:hypothetical protein